MAITNSLANERLQAEIGRLKSELADAKALNDKKDEKIDKLNTELANKSGRLETTAEQLAALAAKILQSILQYFYIMKIISLVLTYILLAADILTNHF